MKILVAIAHSNEQKIIKSNISKLNLHSNIKIDYILLWIGNNETIFNLTKKLENSSYDFVINIWICWYKNSNNWVIQIGNINNYSTKKELISPISIIFSEIKTILCSDIYIKDIQDKEEFEFFDMESYGFEYVMVKYDIPRIILKMPADKIWEKLNWKDIKILCEKLNDINYSELFEKIITYLNSIPSREDFFYLKNNYHFTFQEFEILKFQIAKYEALSNNNFKNFFNKNITLKKEKFIEKLSKKLIKIK